MIARQSAALSSKIAIDIKRCPVFPAMTANAHAPSVAAMLSFDVLGVING
jgi:hypothetical protein